MRSQPRGLEFASRGGAGRRKGCASLRGIWQPCSARSRCPRVPGSPRACRRTARIAALSASISVLMRWRTDSDEWASPSPAEAIDGGEEVFQLEDAARRRDVLVRGDAADRRLMHLDRIGHRLEIERSQVLHAVREETGPAGARSPRRPAGWCARADRGSSPASWRSAGTRAGSPCPCPARAVRDTRV